MHVDAGKDVQDADVYHAFHYAGCLKNSKVCVAEIDTLLTKIDCEKTKNISKYHSFEFGTSSMKMTQYYGIGDGIEQIMDIVTSNQVLQ